MQGTLYFNTFTGKFCPFELQEVSTSLRIFIMATDKIHIHHYTLYVLHNKEEMLLLLKVFDGGIVSNRTCRK